LLENKPDAKMETMFKVLFTTCSIVLLCIPILAEPDTPKYYNDIEKGIASLKEEEPDSALFYFWQASLKGMPRDSLYFFLAKIYIVRGVFDTALALNYAINAPVKSSFKRATLQQRYVIFSYLNLTHRANETLDSLWEHRDITARDFLPGIRFYSSTGYNSDYKLKTIKYPWHEPGITPNTDTIGDFDHAFRIISSWRIPIKRSVGLLLQGQGTVRKPYLAEAEFFERDSLDLSGRLGIGLDGLFKHFQVQYEWMRKKNYLHSLVSTNTVSLFYSDFNEKMFYFVNILYGVDIGKKWSINDQYVNILANLCKAISPVNRLSVNVGGTFLIMDEFVFNQRTYTFPVLDFARAVDSTTLPGMVFLKQNGNTITDTLRYNTTQSMPNSNVSLSPSLRFEQDLPLNFSIQFGLQWIFTYYYDDYQWSDFKLDSLNVITNMVTYDNNTGDYYWVTELSDAKANIKGDVFSHFTYGPLERHSKKRIDNCLSIGMAIRKLFTKVGILELESELCKAWSTLFNDAPVPIQDWNWYVALQWRKRFYWKKKA
jgi:hypothetical protein